MSECVSETLLLLLYVCTIQSQRPDALLSDTPAAELIHRLSLNNAMLAQAQVVKEVQVAPILHNRQFDQDIGNFLTRNSDVIVVYLGCGTLHSKPINGLKYTELGHAHTYAK
jgi:O-methyltransferase involved in polyketide biosynthesis